jgi:hypothetical protein
MNPNEKDQSTRSQKRLEMGCAFFQDFTVSDSEKPQFRAREFD